MIKNRCTFSQWRIYRGTQEALAPRAPTQCIFFKHEDVFLCGSIQHTAYLFLLCILSPFAASLYNNSHFLSNFLVCKTCCQLRGPVPPFQNPGSAPVFSVLDENRWNHALGGGNDIISTTNYNTLYSFCSLWLTVRMWRLVQMHVACEQETRGMNWRLEWVDLEACPTDQLYDTAAPATEHAVRRGLSEPAVSTQ